MPGNGGGTAEERWQAAVRRREQSQLALSQDEGVDSSAGTPLTDRLAIAVYFLGAAFVVVAVVMFHLQPHSEHAPERTPAQTIPNVVVAPPLDELPQAEKKAPKVATPARASAFVGVREGKFEVNCQPFYVAGFNAHDLMEIAMLDTKEFKLQNDVPGHLRVRETLREASEAGLNVVRMWGYANHEKFPLQVAPGIYNEDALRSLDYVLSEARQFGVRVILAFADNWQYVGGVDEYVDWSDTAPKRTITRQSVDGWTFGGQPRDSSYEAERHALFFSDKGSKKLYKDHVKEIIYRRNHVHGRLYKDDPTIFAWNLINEPRCRSIDREGCISAVQEWIEEMSVFVKRMDPNHLVTIGTEGFFSTDLAWSDANPGRWAEKVGQEFIANHRPEAVDFAGFHAWPDNWNRPDLEFHDTWVRAHEEANVQMLQKPLLLEEFGKGLDNEQQDSLAAIESLRDPHYNDTLAIVANSILMNRGMVGAMFWRLHLSTYAGRGRGRYGVKTSDTTFKYIRDFTAIVQSAGHSQPPRKGCKTECWVPYSKGTRQICIQDPNACNVYWDVAHQKGEYKGLSAHEVVVPVWDVDVRLSQLQFYSSSLECCRKGVGAFKNGCDIADGYPAW